MKFNLLKFIAMKKVLMSMAVIAAMVAFASCGGNNNKGGEAAPAADADAPAVVDDCCGECCTDAGCDGCTGELDVAVCHGVHSGYLVLSRSYDDVV